MNTNVEKLKKTLFKGMHVVLDYMDDPHAVPAGTHGIVQFVDDMGQIHVSWKTGSSLALIPEVDKFHVEDDSLLAHWMHGDLPCITNEELVKLAEEEEALVDPGNDPYQGVVVNDQPYFLDPEWLKEKLAELIVLEVSA